MFLIDWILTHFQFEWWRIFLGQRAVTWPNKDDQAEPADMEEPRLRGILSRQTGGGNQASQGK